MIFAVISSIKLKNILRFSLFIFLMSVYVSTYASTNSQFVDIDNMIINNKKTLKSTEKLIMPDYGVDIVTFERLSKIRNIFNLSHELPFQKKETSAGQMREKKEADIPEELQQLMTKKKTFLENFPINSFRFKGSVYQGDKDWGVIESSKDTKLYYLKENDPIGESYGIVKSIGNDGIVIQEWKKDTLNNTWKKTDFVLH
ncbi:pilus assembly protein PilP [Pseudofrancisella aestuarii]|uniref:Pilus assembly protein PilP n=1 Tax=Pseudofrancisella aestuarii TaxID=2670347 RepID=A0ABV9T8R5_9GAMM|nr:pilus assembly protein PilP [Pseudofrancisella aestuarii]